MSMSRLLSGLATALFVLLVSGFSSASLAQTTPQIARGNCSVCASSCQKTLDYCIGKKGRYSEGNILNTLKDCITSCKTCGEILERGSSLEKKASALCVDACYAAAKSCEAFKSDNNMKACADECRKCAGNCQKVAAGDL